jgi:mevalonate kinase
MTKHKKYYYLLLLVIIINFSLSGCLDTKVSNCRKIIDISTQLSEITQTNLATKDKDKILEIADDFDKSSQQILEKKIKDQQLKEYSQKLAIIYQNYGRITRSFVDAFQNKDTEKAIIYKEEVTKLSQEQENLVNSINNYCQQN